VKGRTRQCRRAPRHEIAYVSQRCRRGGGGTRVPPWKGQGCCGGHGGDGRGGVPCERRENVLDRRRALRRNQAEAERVFQHVAERVGLDALKLPEAPELRDASEHAVERLLRRGVRLDDGADHSSEIGTGRGTRVALPSDGADGVPHRDTYRRQPGRLIDRRLRARAPELSPSGTTPDQRAQDSAARGGRALERRTEHAPGDPPDRSAKCRPNASERRTKQTGERVEDPRHQQSSPCARNRCFAASTQITFGGCG
jgi:hypothetical protein